MVVLRVLMSSYACARAGFSRSAESESSAELANWGRMRECKIAAWDGKSWAGTREFARQLGKLLNKYKIENKERYHSVV
ncbi:hypothetical protein B0I35DRAFT_46058 [Stachybotrys elegans]|uniref:Uncharacterized protein n=1 Tax=Stachybotrys elegans TaxID=80388 RepID=A0A8K0WZ28_9HYPO|nr:hypothetical protein B0I35DRAFT_46058 [Stachybotrys elegans]